MIDRSARAGAVSASSATVADVVSRQRMRLFIVMGSVVKACVFSEVAQGRSDCRALDEAPALSLKDAPGPHRQHPRAGLRSFARALRAPPDPRASPGAHRTLPLSTFGDRLPGPSP